MSPLDSTNRTLPPTPSHSDASAADSSSVFDRAAQQTDDGEQLAPDDALPRKTPMTLDWEPDAETYRLACYQRGLAADANVHAALVDFREHYAAQPGRTNTHADWTRRFARWVSENTHRQQRTAHTGGHPNANRRDRTPARRRTAQEARAAAEGRTLDPGPDIIDGEWRHAEPW